MSYPKSIITSIVIVSWNTAELLRACLDSIREQAGDFPYQSIEVIIVDNNSSDGSVDMIRSEFPEVRLIHNTHNKGFAQGTNQGAHEAQGQYVLFLNPDTELLPGSMKFLIDFMDLNPDAGAAGAKLLNPDGTLQISVYPGLSLAREFWRLFHLDRFHPLSVYPVSQWNQDIAHTVDIVQGACLILRRGAIEEVGLLDEDYFMYTEEVDLCHRLRQSGWGVYWVPQAEVLHYGGQSTKQRRIEMFLQLYASKILFFRKHYGRPRAIVYKMILALASLPRLLAFPVHWGARVSKLELDQDISSLYLRLFFALPSM